VCDGISAYIDNNDITIAELMEYVKAPDFPTGCVIYGYEGVREAFETGRGRVVMRGEATIEEDNRRSSIVVTSLPYLTNPSEMIKRTVELIKEDKIDGISNIENLSNKKNGTKIIYELKRDAVANVVLNKLYQYTALQSSFSVNNVALVNGRPMSLNLKNIIVEFVKHRHEVVVRRTKFDLQKALDRAHILEGLLKALDIIDEIIALIRSSKTVEDARNGLMEKWQFSEIQAQEIVNMRLRQLVGLEREKLQNEYDELMKKIDYLRLLLENKDLRMQIIKEELAEMKEKYGDERRSKIEFSASDFRIEDTIADEEVVITISHLGYIKRTPLTEYKAQNRGGKGSRGSATRDEDFVEDLYIATNHNYLLFFTEKGKCFWLRVYEVPEGNKTSKGRAIQNLLNIEPDDKVKAVINVKNLSDEEYINNNYIILCSEKGVIKKTSLEAYSRPRVNGINAITIREDDHLLIARLTNGTSEIMMALHSGKAVRFNEKTVRPMGRNASGVKGITLANDKDFVVGMISVSSPEYDILVVSENGYGKRSSIDEYRVTNRGGKGVRTINITEKTGGLIAIKNVLDTDDLMIINKSGIAIRLHVDSLRVMGRATQGVRLINLKDDDSIAAVTQVPREDEEEEIIEVETE
jgi:DNA gyrase subunit A